MIRTYVEWKLLITVYFFEIFFKKYLVRMSLHTQTPYNIRVWQTDLPIYLQVLKKHYRDQWQRPTGEKGRLNVRDIFRRRGGNTTKCLHFDQQISCTFFFHFIDIKYFILNFKVRFERDAMYLVESFYSLIWNHMNEFN